MHFLGLDIGSSSIKASILDGENGNVISSATSPSGQELPMQAIKSGWAEQEPESWWKHLKNAVKALDFDPEKLEAIGISYQMHGLVAVDKNHKVLRQSIIWCDSRAVEIGNKAFYDIGEETALSHLLNSPGNFTASKLKWVKENEPEIYEKIHKIMLPGDYIAMCLSGEITTTASGLSEGIFWDFKKDDVADILLDHYGIEKDKIANIVPGFGIQAEVSFQAAKELGLKEGTKICYRAGDQPNNAFSLNVLNKGEIAATAGTSGVVYGIADTPEYDPQSRVNTFLHVNHNKDNPSYGVLLCLNGTGIQNSWLKNQIINFGNNEVSYNEINKLAEEIAVGSDGVKIYPFGNGAERMLGNKNPGGSIKGLNFNRHDLKHIMRAAQEGIVFGLNYGIEIMKGVGIVPDVVRAGNANMFLSKVFQEAFCNTTGATVELYDTDGAAGAARGAGVGSGYYKTFQDAFQNLKKIDTIEPKSSLKDQYKEIYRLWEEHINS